MKDDVRNTIYQTLTIFAVGVVIWIAFIFLNACGPSLSCNRGLPTVAKTPIPTIIPANMPAMETHIQAEEDGTCRVAASELVGAWVNAGASETDAFPFNSVDGAACEATFADVQAVLAAQNLWAAGATSCTSCHSADFNSAKAKLDLTSYAGITAGSQRADAESTGNDVLGGGKWESSLLYQFMMEAKPEIQGHEAAVTGFTHSGMPAPEATPAP